MSKKLMLELQWELLVQMSQNKLLIATKGKLNLDNAFPSSDDAAALLPTSLDELPAI
jgi:hypothetical protein